MREIKFRVWADDKFYDKCLVGNTNNTNDEKWTCPMVWLEDRKEWVHCDNGDICQYTGLKDKNGKEIYEGDILRNVYYKYSNDENGNKGFKEEILKVVYRACGFIYELIKINELESYYGEDGDDFIEVIGNIYENPELMEAKNE